MNKMQPEAALLGQLTLADKVQLLTGHDFWATWPNEKIGLRRHYEAGEFSVHAGSSVNRLPLIAELTLEGESA
jgi:hypothetical protein